MTEAIQDGQWHSFGPQRSAPIAAGNSFAASAPRGATNITASRLSTLQFGRSTIAGSRTLTTGNAFFAGRSVTSGFLTRGGTLGSTAVGGFGRFGSFGIFPVVRPFGFGFRTSPLFRRPFFGLGFGLGFGFGWDSCWDYAWTLDPFCVDPLWAWPPYGYYGAPGYLYPDSQDNLYTPTFGSGTNFNPGGNSTSQNNTQPDSSSLDPSAQVNPNTDTSADAGQLILVRRDGQILQTVAFMASGERLTYITPNGVRRSFPIAELDKDATRQMNDASGSTVALPN